MSEKQRLQLENELLMTCSKAQAINKYIDELEESSKLSELWCKSQQENQELKNTVMNLQKELNEENLQCSKYAIENQDLKEQKREWINLLEMFKNQQKEFIEYLENEIKRLAKECSHTYEDSLGKLLYVNEDIFNEVNKILSKYKEIIGSDK